MSRRNKTKQQLIHEMKQRAWVRRQEEAGKAMNDATGKKIEVGQVVELQVLGMMKGEVTKVVETVIAMPGQPPLPPHVVVTIQFAKFFEGKPNLNYIYVIHDAPVRVDVQEEPGKVVIPS